MNMAEVQKIADAVLYEGYLLYPYRLSSLKNRERWLFGRVYPRSYSQARGGMEPWSMQTECLVKGSSNSTIDVKVRFLHALAEESRDAVERDVFIGGSLLSRLTAGSRDAPFRFPARGEARSALEGSLELRAEMVRSGLFKVAARIENLTPFEVTVASGRADVLERSLLSTYTLLEVGGGEFVSLLDPPPSLSAAAAGCRNVGTWPVLAGERGTRTTMLSSPIILYDYPQVAPESPGDLFDATEIDELLTLRILSLTGEERERAREESERARALIERTEGLSAREMARLHGAVRSLQAERRKEGSRGKTRGLSPGDQVRVRPRGGADAFDILLDGKIATVRSVERDYEGRIHVAVTIDEDPGSDLGVSGQPGHRFFFRPRELDRLGEQEAQE